MLGCKEKYHRIERSESGAVLVEVALLFSLVVLALGIPLSLYSLSLESKYQMFYFLLFF